jgi:hypothetical protein
MQIAAIVDLVEEVQMLSGTLYWLLRCAERAAEKPRSPLVKRPRNRSRG